MYTARDPGARSFITSAASCSSSSCLPSLTRQRETDPSITVLLGCAWGARVYRGCRAPIHNQTAHSRVPESAEDENRTLLTLLNTIRRSAVRTRGGGQALPSVDITAPALAETLLMLNKSRPDLITAAPELKAGSSLLPTSPADVEPQRQGCCAYAPSRSSSIPPAHVSRNEPLVDAPALITTVLSAGSQRPLTASAMSSAGGGTPNSSVTAMPTGTATSVVDPSQTTGSGPGMSETPLPDGWKDCGVAATDAWSTLAYVDPSRNRCGLISPNHVQRWITASAAPENRPGCVVTV